jgi:hypothetical protein
MLSFLFGCVALAVCIAIGFFILNVGITILVMLIAGIFTGLANLWAYLRKPTTNAARRHQEGN